MHIHVRCAEEITSFSTAGLCTIRHMASLLKRCIDSYGERVPVELGPQGRLWFIVLWRCVKTNTLIMDMESINDSEIPVAMSLLNLRIMAISKLMDDICKCFMINDIYEKEKSNQVTDACKLLMGEEIIENLDENPLLRLSFHTGIPNVLNENTSCFVQTSIAMYMTALNILNERDIAYLSNADYTLSSLCMFFISDEIFYALATVSEYIVENKSDFREAFKYVCLNRTRKDHFLKCVSQMKEQENYMDRIENAFSEILEYGYIYEHPYNPDTTKPVEKILSDGKYDRRVLIRVMMTLLQETCTDCEYALSSFLQYETLEHINSIGEMCISDTKIVMRNTCRVVGVECFGHVVKYLKEEISFDLDLDLLSPQLCDSAIDAC